MNVQHFDISGSVVFWNVAAETNMPRLQAELEMIDEVEFLPGERTPFAAAKRAATKMYKRDHRVMSLAEEKRVTVERITYGEIENTYTQVAYILVDDSGLQYVHCMSGSDEETEQLKQAWHYEFTLCSANAVGAALAKAIEKLDGYSLRPNGGVYFLPNWTTTRFEKIAAAFNASGASGRTGVHRMEVAHGDGTVRSVHQRITEQFRQRVSEMRQELAEGLKKRGRENRASEVEGMISKAAKYETLLDQSLAEVRAELQEMQTQLAMETIAQSAVVFEEMQAA